MDYTNYSRQRGTLPDWAWYQLNGKSAEENLMEQRKIFYEGLADQEDSEEDVPQVSFTGEVKVK